LKKKELNQKKNIAKTKKNRVRPKKPSQAGLSRFFSKKQTEQKPKPIGLNQFWFKKTKFSLVIFFDKNRTKPKIITSS